LSSHGSTRSPEHLVPGAASVSSPCLHPPKAHRAPALNRAIGLGSSGQSATISGFPLSAILRKPSPGYHVHAGGIESTRCRRLEGDRSGKICFPARSGSERIRRSVIQHAVWLYLRFTLSYRDVEDLLAERGLDVSYETVRSWVLKFGPVIARRLIYRGRRDLRENQLHQLKHSTCRIALIAIMARP